MFVKERSVRLCPRVLTAERAKQIRKPGDNSDLQNNPPRSPPPKANYFFNSIKHFIPFITEEEHKDHD
ncbi:hypothetical protein ASD24_20970 [Paenibacillus sp. Root52]|nr:hypothetical protein ASD24_20970 [Paenibacillus sp. Root52]